MGMTALLLGRAERSTPEARRGHAVWRAGVDGESASRAIIAIAHDGVLRGATPTGPCRDWIANAAGGPERGPCSCAHGEGRWSRTTDRWDRRKMCRSEGKLIARGTPRAAARRSETRSGRGGLQAARRRQELAPASSKREWRRGLSGAIGSRAGSRFCLRSARATELWRRVRQCHWPLDRGGALTGRMVWLRAA